MNSSSNPSDYEFLLRTLTEGNYIAKAQSLKRFNALILSDKKQFSTYAKRIVIAIQELMTQPKDDINLLAGTLALQIINLNPRDIQFYVKSKLLKSMVINLGDTKPQIRKTSHYCLLAYIRIFKNFDDIIQVYIANGLLSMEWQLRQKSINSFQSILVMEMRYLNWYTNQFKRIFQLLLTKLKDQNGFVQKASEQCLLSLSKVQEIRNFSKKLSPTSFNLLKVFCQQQLEIGNLHEIKLDIDKKPETERYFQMPDSLQMKQSQNTISLINTQKLEKYRSGEELQQRYHQGSLRGQHGKGKQLNYSLNLKQSRSPQRDRNMRRQSSVLFPPINLNQNPTKQEKLQLIVGKKLLQDLKNDKDWKVRLQAIEQLQTRFQVSKAQFETDVLMKNLLPILIRLLGDANFKVALVALKIIQDILRVPQVSLQTIAPQIVEKLSDNKVALRQNISKLIKMQYNLTKEPIWLDSLLLHIKKSANSNIKEEVLNILSKLYDDGNIPYSFEKIIDIVYPLMDDSKTKIKIKTLDLLAIITIKSQKIDKAKTILATKLNQVYYEMYLQKIGKELKAFREANPSVSIDKQPQRQKGMRISMNQLSRKANKIGNTTSTSLQRIANTQKEQNSTVKATFYEPKLIENDEKVNNVVTNREDTQNYYETKQQQISPNDITVNSINSDQLTPLKKKTDRYLRRRVLKSVQSRLSTTNYSNEDSLPPFNDATKEMKNILIEIKSQDWQISNESLNKFRRIILHHEQLLTNANVKLIVPDIMRITESLRSTLSKSALIVINELSLKLKRQLDPQLDLIFSKLIKKSLDTSSFISEEVKKALINVCSNCHQSKVVNLLNNSHTSRAIPIKTAVINILQGVTFLPKFYEKELEKIIAILIDFMSEGSLEIRQKTKALLNSIIASQKGPSIMKLIPVEHRNKLKKRQQSIVSQTRMLQLSHAVEQKKAQSKPEIQIQEFPKKKKKNKITDFPIEFQQLDTYLENCQSSDWKIRLQNMTLISQLCFRYSEQVMQHRSNSRIIDVLSKQINDPNVKVSANALKIFQQLTTQMPTLIETSLSVILNEIFICFSSSKAQVRTLSEQLFEMICKQVQKWMLTQHICNGALYSVQKSKPVILQKLTQLVPSIYKLKPNIFQKNVYPMINKLAQENKPETNGPLKNLIEALYTEIGQDCMSYLKQKAKNLIFQ